MSSDTRSTTTFSFSLLTKALLIVMPIVLATPSKAFGYADPGTGAFVYQAVYVGFLTGTFYLRKVLDRLWGKRNK